MAIRRIELVKSICTKVGMARSPVDNVEHFTKAELVQLNTFLDVAMQARVDASTQEDADGKTS